MEAGPMPWIFKISFSLNCDSCSNVVISSWINALLAGADIDEKVKSLNQIKSAAIKMKHKEPVT